MTKNGEKKETDRGGTPELWKESGLVRPPQSISDQIYDLLKKKILNSEILPGERLMQEEVAKAFNASRTPIRQAFHLLEKDGLSLLEGKRAHLLAHHAGPAIIVVGVVVVLFPIRRHGEVKLHEPRQTVHAVPMVARHLDGVGHGRVVVVIDRVAREHVKVRG